MNFITAFQADRLISQIRDEPDPTSPGAKRAFEKLAKLGNGAVPKVLEALGSADKRQTAEYVTLLSRLTSDKTLPLIARGLADGDPRTVQGTASALSSNKRFNVNRLVDMLGEDEYSKSAIIEILTAHKERLNLRQLLAQIYYLQPSEKTAVFRLISELATQDHVPDLLQRMDGKDPIVKMHILGVLAQFDTPEVRKAMAEQLKDTNKYVRQAALEGVKSMKVAVDVETICSLLLDPDVEVIQKAVDVIVEINDPNTVKYLIPALKDENEFSRRAAVEVLNEIGTTSSVKHLLEAVADEDWWVRSRASDALARIGGPRVVSAVLELIKDDDENIRRAAIEILYTCRDERAMDQLIEAVADEDWWVSERAAEALAELGDPKAVPAVLGLLARNDRSAPVALRALGKLGGPEMLDKVLPYLERSDKDLRIAAIEAATQLAGEEHAEAVLAHIEPVAESTDDTVARAALRAVQKLEGRTVAGDQFAATGTGYGAARRSGTASGGASAARHRPAPAPTAHRRAPASARPPAEPEGGATHENTLLADARALEDTMASRKERQAIDVGALKAGDVIEGRYKFIEKIGKGAFGTVVLVEDTVVEERLILKFLNPNVSSDEEMMKRFVHELRYSRRITHKNVIRIYDFLHLGGCYAISMEYFPSHTLGTEIANEKPMPPKKAVRYALDICTGMHIAHQQGIIHRDLKPANLLIDDTGLLKIVDFGVAAAAKSGDTQLTKTGYVIGSPKYMAPEQILGKKVDERADIYSLGVILYEMLAGEPPYSRGDHMAVMYQHVQGKAAPLSEANPDVPEGLAEIVAKAMSVDKAKRHGSMEELRRALVEVAKQLADA